MSTGLIIGKFMPPHAGHQYLIDYARRQVDQLTVIIFTKSFEPLPVALRAAWLREMNPGQEILHITDEHPVDFASAAVWQLWIDSIRRVYPRGPDVVFSSEQYGHELAQRLGARHVLVDIERRQVPVSGEQIRARPMDYWAYLAPCVRAYFARRVAVLGAESTGKTTLAQNLARHFDTVWVPEFARDYLLARNGVCTEADMPVIARGQVETEDALARQANRVLVCDTDLLTTSLWHEHYWGYCPDEIRSLADQRRHDLYLVCDIDVPWIDDGLRDAPRQRAWFHRRFQAELARRGRPYIVLSGSFAARWEAAVRAIGSILLSETAAGGG